MVSTQAQARDGILNSLAAQEKKLRQAGAERIFKDTFTGDTADRPEYRKMADRMQSGDKLIVAKLDRIARNLEQGISKSTLQRAKKNFIST